MEFLDPVANQSIDDEIANFFADDNDNDGSGRLLPEAPAPERDEMIQQQQPIPLSLNNHSLNNGNNYCHTTTNSKFSSQEMMLGPGESAEDANLGGFSKSMFDDDDDDVLVDNEVADATESNVADSFGPAKLTELVRDSHRALSPTPTFFAPHPERQKQEQWEQQQQQQVQQQQQQQQAQPVSSEITRRLLSSSSPAVSAASGLASSLFVRNTQQREEPPLKKQRSLPNIMSGRPRMVSTDSLSSFGGGMFSNNNHNQNQQHHHHSNNICINGAGGGSMMMQANNSFSFSRNINHQHSQPRLYNAEESMSSPNSSFSSSSQFRNNSYGGNTTGLTPYDALKSLVKRKQELLNSGSGCNGINTTNSNLLNNNNMNGGSNHGNNSNKRNGVARSSSRNRLMSVFARSSSRRKLLAKSQSVGALDSVGGVNRNNSFHRKRKQQNEFFSLSSRAISATNSGGGEQQTTTTATGAATTTTTTASQNETNNNQNSSTLAGAQQQQQQQQPSPSYKFHFKQETYKYPLNLAIQRRAESADLCSIIQSSPTVLSEQDGQNGETPLLILMKFKPDDAVTMEKMLTKFPSLASTHDRHFNTALHAACKNGSSLEIIRRLYQAYPGAAQQRNFHGLTPLQVAQRAKTINNEVTAFLSNVG